jgi:hypothetical protein
VLNTKFMQNSINLDLIIPSKINGAPAGAGASVFFKKILTADHLSSIRDFATSSTATAFP